MIHIRQPYVPASQQMLELPRDIVWLQRGTWALGSLFAVILFVVGVRAFVLAPWFSIQNMKVAGDAHFHNTLTLRANVLPQLTGNFFTLSLQRTQQAFEALPWIRSAVVQREFPNQIKVSLTAHTPIARWMSLGAGVNAESKSDIEIEQLLNSQGDVFETTGGQIDTDTLPQLAGPVRKAADVLSLFKNLQTAIKNSPLGGKREIVQLSLSPLGLWQAVLDNKATLELGSGSKEEILLRTTRWLSATAELANKYQANELQSVDLRYPNGFATRLSGITTNTTAK